MTDCQKILSKFSSNKNGRQLNFVILEWPMEKIDQVVEFNLKYFVTAETMHTAAGISENEEALKEYLSIFPEFLKSKKHEISVCCLEEDVEFKNIIGVSIVDITKRDEKFPDIKFQTKEIPKLIEMLFAMAIIYDAAESLSVDEFYAGKGLCVSPEYRGLGIAQEMLRVRRLICKEHNMPFTSAWMTSIGTQIAATRDGWETVFELDLRDFEKQVDVQFKNAPPTFKFMIARV